MKTHHLSQNNIASRRSNPFTRISGRLMAILAAVLLASPFAQAGSVTWGNTGTDFNFNAGGNWLGGSAPGVGDNATFSGVKTTNPNLSLSGSVQGLTFETTATSGYTLSSSNGATNLTLTNTGTTTNSAIYGANTSGTNTISAPLVLGAATSGTQTFTQVSGGTLAISGPISEANTGVKLVYSGNGIFSISGANTYTGATAISGSATVRVNNIVVAGGSSGLGNAASPVVLGDSTLKGTLAYTGNTASFTRGLTLGNGGSELDVTTSGQTLTISTGAIGGAGTFTLGGAGNFIIDANVQAGALLQTSSGTVTINGVITGSTLVKYGASGTAGLLTLTNAANSFTGGIGTNGNGSMVADSTVVLANTGSTSALGSAGAIAINNKTITLQGFTAAQSTNRTWNVGNTTAALNNNGSNTVTLSGTVINNVAVGTFALGGTYTSGTNVISGNVQDGSSTLGMKIVAGNWAFTGANTYTGATTIGAGTLSADKIVVSSGSSSLGNATSAVVLGDASNKGTLSYIGNTASYTRGFTVNAGGGEIDTTASGQTLTIATGNITGSGLLTIGGAGNTTISSAIQTGAGGVTKTGAGTVTLSGSNTYTGLTTASGSGGILTINSNVQGNVAQTAGTVNVYGIISGASTALSYGNGASSSAFTLFNAANSFGGGITTGGYGYLNASATTVLADIGSNSALGSSGTLQINNTTWNLGGFTAAQSSNRTWNVGNVAAALNNNGSNTITLSGSITNNIGANGVLTLGGSYVSGLNVISGSVSNGSNTLGIKASAGYWALTGASTYTGNTTVNGGSKLVVSGSLSGNTAVTVASGGELNVSGLINPAATAMALSGTLSGVGTVGAVNGTGGTVTPGTLGIGTINTGTLNLDGTSHLDIEIGRTSAGGGVLSNDRANVTGSVTLTSGADLKLSLASGQNNPIVGDILYLVINDLADSVTGVFTKLNNVNTTLAEGSLFTYNSVDYQITYKANSEGTPSFTGGNDVALMAVPEPETWVILAGGFGMLIGMQKIRRRAGR